jgi:hypothetical protein
MTWSAQFQTDLKNRQTADFVFRLEFIRTKFGVGTNYTIDNSNTKIQIQSEQVRINGTRVVNQSFSTSFGEFSLRLVGDYRTISQNINRGSVAILYVGFKDYATANYQRLIWGSLSGIRKINFETFELSFDDALSTLNNRFDVRYDSGLGLHKSALFYSLGQSTTMTSNFAIATDTQLAVTDVTIFQRDSSGRGLIGIYNPSNTPQEILYAEWSSKTITSGVAGYLTMSASPLVVSYPSLTGSSVFPATITSSNSVVYNYAQIADFPPHIIGKIIQSGSGSGALDDLPSQWSVSGFGELPADIYDYVDAEQQKAYIVAASTTYRWRIALNSPQTEFIRTISGKASDLGQWPVLRQGRVSWRGVTDPYSPTTPNPLKSIAYEITDDDIIRVASHDLFDTNANAVFSSFNIVRDQAGNKTLVRTGTNLDSLPAYAQAVDRGDGLTYDPQFTRANMATADGARMENYQRLVAEKISLEMQLHMSRFVAGDNVSVTSSILYGRNEKKTFYNRVGMISGVDIDFGNRSCIVTILFLPPLGLRP